MSCLDVYPSLEALATVTYKSRDFFGLPVKAFEYGLTEHPPVVLLGDLYGCMRSSEIIADTILRYAGDTHVLAIPCVSPSLSGGLRLLSKVLTGEEATSLDELLEKIKSYGIPPKIEGSQLFRIGNTVLVVTERAEVLDALSHSTQELVDGPVIAISPDGSIRLLSAPEELFVKPLQALLENISPPLLVLYLSCWSEEKSCFVVSKSSYERLRELLSIAASQLESAAFCTAPVFVEANTLLEQIFPSAAVIEVRVGLENYLELTKSVSAILGTAYLLRGVLS
ncbi:hypothetical protein IG193_05140 [Infirmifilum lucidum]|uniref:Uncharacterized protein n=1 Tax=Infirmifilum lucidum TaxID=2776706 RepID=A0A7L9FEF1_9CREN|nr:hypothetical protein [Infirmifilum lucidum]QOJ78170.1 hypothetical protein IG193_05140 [Infirmifilum lucidum]